MTVKGLLTRLMTWVILLVVVVQSGCEDEPPPPAPQTGRRLKARQTQLPAVPIIIWRVSAAGDELDPQTPSTTNRGCRLTSRQITDYVLDLDRFCRTRLDVELVFGIEGPEDDVRVITIPVQDDMIPSSGPRTQHPYVWERYVLSRIAQIPDPHNPGETLLSTRVVNIFFGGDVTWPELVALGKHQLAFTIDPGEATTQDPAERHRRHIFVNDLGFESGPGSHDPSLPILQHEFMHYLLRQDGVCIQYEQDLGACTLGTSNPSGHNGRYSWQEHSEDPWNVMYYEAHYFIVSELDKKDIAEKARQGERWYNVP